MASTSEGVQTYYVVQSFSKSDKGLTMDEPIQAFSEQCARRLAGNLSTHKPICIAFFRSGNPNTGDFEDAKILVSYGEIPREIMDMMSGESF
ncbi:hypothetical protein LRS73_26765 [Methylobacterium currus]|uniref:hypothetical protein n=1 Tax=Methylobacterium currus TaxID=2051553 RepID=UPI001E604807|nr:hypothetical protein [Methylobacterium currus]UHC16038.1 hypothetical protein LRS73_26765 [Methylobacterium currus]